MAYLDNALKRRAKAPKQPLACAGLYVQTSVLDLIETLGI